MDQWDAGRSVELWWKDKTRRINRNDSSKRKGPTGNSSNMDDTETEKFTWGLSDWETRLECDNEISIDSTTSEQLDADLSP